MAEILDNKHPGSPSLFRATALLREARRQKGLSTVDVPPVCILDPDGDIVRRLRREGHAKPFEGWPCYHTQLDVLDLAGTTAGIVGCAVGAPFAVLIAEELFASGCQLLDSHVGQKTSGVERTKTQRLAGIVDRSLRLPGHRQHQAPERQGCRRIGIEHHRPVECRAGRTDILRGDQ
jgi:hypothetical protein